MHHNVIQVDVTPGIPTKMVTLIFFKAAICTAQAKRHSGEAKNSYVSAGGCGTRSPDLLGAQHERFCLPTFLFIWQFCCSTLVYSSCFVVSLCCTMSVEGREVDDQSKSNPFLKER
uniref:Uncharacterized protein n=1 Tax=Oryzias latipes TaxID=8090 RepID=A0A3P9J0I6_ORYLA